MNLTVNREGKYAIVWMTNAEKADPKVMDSLQPLIAECEELSLIHISEPTRH
mgnify:CR=1 FL=1